MLMEQLMKILERDTSNEEKAGKISDFIEGSIERASLSAAQWGSNDSDYMEKELERDLWGYYDDEE